MITYEVNICVPNKMLDDYIVWFMPHMRDMLHFKGFQKAEYHTELRAQDKDSTTLVAQYLVDSLDNLDDYFEHHAPTVRQEAIDKFGNDISFKRRILQKQEEYFSS